LILATKNPELVRSLTIGEPPILPWLEGTQEGVRLLATFMMNVWEPLKRSFQIGNMEDGALGRSSMEF
jgi:hypothetical protein